MPAGGSDLQRALGTFLSLDVAQIQHGFLARVNLRLGPRQNLCALEVIGDLDQRGRRDDLDVRAGPGSLRAAGRRTDEAFIACIGADGSGQHTGHRREGAIEPEFAEHGETAQGIRRNRADCRHQSERNRQIVMAAFLRQIGGREIDDDPPCRQSKTRGDQRGTDPFARFGHRLVRQADDQEIRQTGHDLNLHVDRAGLDPLKGYGGNTLNHAALIRDENLT